MHNFNFSGLTTKQDRTDYLFEAISHTQLGGAFYIYKLISELPAPTSSKVLPNPKYCGPFNPVEAQLDEDGYPLLYEKPFNQVDAFFKT